MQLTTIGNTFLWIMNTHWTNSTFGIFAIYFTWTSAILFLHNLSFAFTCDIVQKTLIIVSFSISSTNWFEDFWANFWTYWKKIKRNLYWFLTSMKVGFLYNRQIWKIILCCILVNKLRNYFPIMPAIELIDIISKQLKLTKIKLNFPFKDLKLNATYHNR